MGRRARARTRRIAVAAVDVARVGKGPDPISLPRAVRPTAPPSDTPDAASPALMTGMNVAAQILLAAPRASPGLSPPISARAPGQREYPAVRIGRRYHQPCRRAKTRVGA